MDEPAFKPDSHLVERFAADLDALSDPSARLGIAVSGGPDSLALLLLAAAVRPGAIEAATVDHALRPDSRAEAEMVAALCARLGVPHAILRADWAEAPATAVQEQARDMRYRLLAAWLAERRLAALATAHHADDQAETVVMRLNRGSGVRGLAAMRAAANLPGTAFPLLRPLLGWRRAELERICADSGLDPATDPSNDDQRYERTRIRQALAKANVLDVEAVGRSARNLAEADAALDWMAGSLGALRITDDSEALRIDPEGLPREILRRIVRIAIARYDSPDPRGPELERALDALLSGGTATLSGLRLEGGARWRLTRAAPRRR